MLDDSELDSHRNRTELGTPTADMAVVEHNSCAHVAYTKVSQRRHRLASLARLSLEVQ